jgi:hypothetical protein
MSWAGLCLVGLVVFPAAAFAQTLARENPVAVGAGAIKGRVLEATSDQPVRKPTAGPSSHLTDTGLL